MLTSDVQILKLVEKLKELGRIRYDTDFCAEVGISKQHFYNIKKQANGEGKQNYHFTLQHAETICRKYGVDGNYIFGLTDQPFKLKPKAVKQ